MNENTERMHIMDKNSNPMQKVLTISIAAYNVQDYIRENLESIVRSGVLDDLEVFVVDDGGNDNTLKIAQEYQSLYPGAIYAVHKENGGYGSTVNWSVKHATGKYIRLLDGDDLFDSEGLQKLVHFLKNNETDWIVNIVEQFNDESQTKRSIHRWEKYDNCVLPVEEIAPEFTVGMWESTFRMDTLKQSWQDLPEHVLYTDMLFVTQPLEHVKTVAFLPWILYRYRLGRDGQSVSRESRIKHCDENIMLIQKMMNRYYEKGIYNLSDFVKHRYTSYYKWIVLNIMLLRASSENLQRIKEIEKDARENKTDFYNAGYESRNITALRKTGYLAYWPLVWQGIKNW